MHKQQFRATLEYLCRAYGISISDLRQMLENEKDGSSDPILFHSESLKNFGEFRRIMDTIVNASTVSPSKEK